jgi:hypothetical protein
MADKDYPREYAILITDNRSIFIRQPKTRNSWTLRQEMRFGTALVTDVAPKALEDYEHVSLETLSADNENLSIPHKMVVSVAMRADLPERRRRDFFVWWVMTRQKEIFQVYNFDLEYRTDHDTMILKFYAVPLGVYFKPRRMRQTRETILREYAADILDTYRTVLHSIVRKLFVLKSARPHCDLGGSTHCSIPSGLQTIVSSSWLCIDFSTFQYDPDTYRANTFDVNRVRN